MEASDEFRCREPMLLAIFAAKGPAAIEFRCGDAAITEKSYQPSRESGECWFKMEAQQTGGVQTNGWAYNRHAGKWGQDYALRAAIALRSLGQNTPEEAL